MSRRYQLKPAGVPARSFSAGGQLNEEPQAVVDAGSGPLLVIAGAGSGKTRTLTWRVARLLHDGMAPAESAGRRNNPGFESDTRVFR
jgi:DNA helicase-2/ATP-dependent DNA helicase PcrA